MEQNEYFARGQPKNSVSLLQNQRLNSRQNSRQRDFSASYEGPVSNSINHGSKLTFQQEPEIKQIPNMQHHRSAYQANPLANQQLKIMEQEYPERQDILDKMEQKSLSP